MEIPPPLPPQSPLPPPLPGLPSRSLASAEQAAQASLFAPVMGIVVNLFVTPQLRGQRIPMLITSSVGMLLILAGFGFGVFALVRARGQQVKFRLKAIIGICLSSILIFLGLLSIPGLIKAKQRAQQLSTLSGARQGFVTKIIRKKRESFAPPTPPEEIFKLVNYRGPLGEMPAYLSPSPGDGKKHPAIIWLVGGFANSINEIAWERGPAKNDQSGSAFREAGIIMMYPSLRGGNENPGSVENFYGEVDDVLAARDFLAQQDYVDPDRIYLGGHSTGGTLVLLIAESSDKFRAVFSFGPVRTPADYGEDVLFFDTSNKKEFLLRAPVVWLSSIHTATFALEGTEEPSNLDALDRLSAASQNDLVHFYHAKGYNHFSTLQPITRLMATKILADNAAGPSNITFSETELSRK